MGGMVSTIFMAKRCDNVAYRVALHYTSESVTYPLPCRVGLVVSVPASHTVGRVFASWPGHTKDHHKNGTNCLPAWHAMR